MNIRTRKPHRRKPANVRIRKHVAVLIDGARVRKLLEVRYTSYGIFYLVELEACKILTNLRRYHRSGDVRRYAPNRLVMSGVVA